MAKISNDEYYTHPILAEYCVEQTKKLLNNKITSYLEPSAGTGVFLKFLDKPYIAYDINPKHKDIIAANFLSTSPEYKKGRCVIGNPPFGYKNLQAVKFFKKAIHYGDFISFILPISQYNNNQQMYEFDMIYSEDLGILPYSDVDVHCCLNIYKRPDNNKLNRKKSYKLQDISIIESRQNNNILPVGSYDIKICAWGSAIGKVLDENVNYAKQFYIIIHNQSLKCEILKVFNDVDWTKEYIMTSTPNLLHWQIYKYLTKVIPNIK